MIRRTVVTISGFLIAGFLLFLMASPRVDNEDGIVRIKSAYPLADTVNRLKKDVADKGNWSQLACTQQSLLSNATSTTCAPRYPT